MVVPLPLAASDPGRRRQQIAAETAKLKARSRTSLGTLSRGGIATRMMLEAINRHGRAPLLDDLREALTELETTDAQALSREEALRLIADR